ncbi:MAG: hypothetical protein ACRCX2_17955 [Paraclostridium sp.]
MSGYTSQIVKNSTYLTNYLNKPTRGRRSLISSEFADYGKTTAMSLTPEDKSLFILLPMYYPEIFMYSDDENDKRVCKGILNYIAQTCKSVDGIADKTLENNGAEYKSQFFTAPMFTNLTGATKEITLNVPAELSGYGVTDFLNHWANQISDEFTGFSPYNGQAMEWNNWSHSCGWVFIKPSKNLSRVSYGALFFQAVPTTIPTSNYNADRTAPGVVELSLTFSVSMVDTRNILVREICESILSKYKATLVVDSSQHGSIKNTYLESVDEINPEKIVDDMLVR